MSESALMRRIMLQLSKLPGCRVFRNNVGQGWVGESKRYDTAATVRVRPGDVVVRAARPLHAGLFKGSGDLIGWNTVEITPEMVGQRIAIFTSLESKFEDGRTTPEQVTWLNAVRDAGGIARVVRSEQEALDAVQSP